MAFSTLSTKGLLNFRSIGEHRKSKYFKENSMTWYMGLGQGNPFVEMIGITCLQIKLENPLSL